jgi:uncharacterized protein YqeY
MSLEERLLEDLKLAMKASRKEEISTLRMVRAQIKDAQISKGEALSDQEVAAVLQKAAKIRKEAMDMFSKGNREDLVAKEQKEFDIITKYLPEQLSEEQIETLIKETISALNVSSEKDFGRVMSAIMPKVKGKADGKIIQQKVKLALTQLPS